MEILCIADEGDPFSIEIAPDDDIGTLIALVESYYGKPFEMRHNGKDLFMGNPRSLVASLGIAPGDMVELFPKRNTQPATNTATVSLRSLPGSITPEQLLQASAQHPEIVREALFVDPELGAILQSKDILSLRQLMMKRYLSQHQAKYSEDKKMKEIASNPDSEENQRRIAEQIRLENIENNMRTALEDYPETFGSVTMLYIPAEINGVSLNVFVDSGAQCSIMSLACVKRCDLEYLLDTKFTGVFKGVGVGKMCGRIHLAQIKLGSSYFPFTISVIEESDIDLLFGLDMLRRHRCTINLNLNVLTIQTSTGDEIIEFLPENQINKK